VSDNSDHHRVNVVERTGEGVDYRAVICEAKRRLSNSDFRLTDRVATVSMENCLLYLPAVELSQTTRSDRGVLASNDAATASLFWEEVSAIEAAIEVCGLKVKHPTSADNRAGAAMFTGLNRRAYAMQLWSWYAIPVRFHNGTIVTINAPRDVLGTPIICTYDPAEFLASWAHGLNGHLEQTVTQQELETRRTATRTLGLVAVLSAGAILAICALLFL
jgi:hypothetical protein